MHNLIEEMPNKLLALISNTTPKHKMNQDITNGERNNELFRIGCALRNQGAGLAEIREALLEKNSGLCIQPLDEAEVADIAKGIMRYPAGRGKAPRVQDVAIQITEYRDILTTKTGRSYQYNGKFWEELEEIQLECLATQFDSEEYANKKRCRDIAYYVKQRSLNEKVNWNNLEKYEIALNNGILNIQTMTLSPHRKENYLEKVLPHNYNPLAKCLNWEQYLANCLGQGAEALQKQKAIEEFIGYLLLPTAPYKKALIVYGPGDTGKTELQYVMINIVGKENICSIALEDLGSSRQVAPIKGKALNVIAELKSRSTLDDAGFKRLVSTGEAIQIDQKFKNPEIYTPYCKHVIFTNVLPRINDPSQAIFNRFLIINFDRVIPYSERDPKIAEKLKEESEGILLKGIEGLKRLIANNGIFTSPDSSQQILTAYENDSDSIFNFVNTYLERKEGAKIIVSDVIEIYRDNYPNDPIPREKIIKALKEIGVCIKKTSLNSVKGSYVVGYQRLDL